MAAKNGSYFIRKNKGGSMKAEDCIFYQLAKTNQAALRFWSKKVARLDVTATQGMILNFLLDEDNVPSRQLGDRVHFDSATLTGLLDRLEAISLIERKPNPKDRRSVLICLTTKGSELAIEIRKQVGEENREFLSELTSDEEETLRNLLNRLRKRRDHQIDS